MNCQTVPLVKGSNNKGNNNIFQARLAFDDIKDKGKLSCYRMYSKLT